MWVCPGFASFFTRKHTLFGWSVDLCVAEDHDLDSTGPMMARHEGQSRSVCANCDGKWRVDVSDSTVNTYMFAIHRNLEVTLNRQELQTQSCMVLNLTCKLLSLFSMEFDFVFQDVSLF